VSTPDTISSLTSALGSSTTTAVANPALEPASVRNGSAAVKQDYQEALGFESVLVNELAQQLVSSSGLSDPGDSSDSSDADASNDPTASAFASLLPGALTNSIMSNGGLGLAAQILPTLTGPATTDADDITAASPVTDSGGETS
jgi:Rod binding domain-containing protein